MSKHSKEKRARSARIVAAQARKAEKAAIAEAKRREIERQKKEELEIKKAARMERKKELEAKRGQRSSWPEWLGPDFQKPAWLDPRDVTNSEAAIVRHAVRWMAEDHHFTDLSIGEQMRRSVIAFEDKRVVLDIQIGFWAAPISVSEEKMLSELPSIERWEVVPGQARMFRYTVVPWRGTGSEVRCAYDEEEEVSTRAPEKLEELEKEAVPGIVGHAVGSEPQVAVKEVASEESHDSDENYNPVSDEEDKAVGDADNVEPVAIEKPEEKKRESSSASESESKSEKDKRDRKSRKNKKEKYLRLAMKEALAAAKAARKKRRSRL